jgi:hypothetical protein
MYNLLIFVGIMIAVSIIKFILILNFSSMEIDPNDDSFLN